MMIQDDDIDFALYMDQSDHDHKVKSANHYADDLVGHFWAENPVIGSSLGFSRVSHLLRFRPHEVTIWAGYSGHGKSLLLGQSVIGFVMQGEPCCIASMEMRPVVTLARMARQAATNSKPGEDFLRGFCEAIDAGLFLYDHQGTVEHNKLIAVIKYASEVKKCRHFVIDSLMKCGIPEDDYNGQKRFVDLLCTVARDTGIHVHLVAHSRKGKDELKPPSKSDILGSSSIANQADNILIVWRNKEKEAAIDDGKDAHADHDALLCCQKQRNGEWEGTLPLWFDAASQQMMETQGRARDLLSARTYAADAF